MMKLILKDIISGFHEEIREGSCREQLPFFLYWKWKMKMLQPGTVSRLQKKSLAATSTKGTGEIRIAPEL